MRGRVGVSVVGWDKRRYFVQSVFDLMTLGTAEADAKCGRRIRERELFSGGNGDTLIQQSFDNRCLLRAFGKGQPAMKPVKVAFTARPEDSACQPVTCL